MPSPIDQIAHETLGRIRESGTYRRMRVLDGLQGPRMIVDGREVLLFAGSNYLDLARHPEVVEALAGRAREWKATLPTEPPASCISKFRGM